MSDEDRGAPADERVLGLSMGELAGVSVDELVGNQTAVKMVMHYYHQLVAQNAALRNERNTYKTYVDGYEKKRTRTAVAAVLLSVSNVGIGFGVNLLTLKTTWPGLATLVPAICFAAAGLYLSFTDAK